MSERGADWYKREPRAWLEGVRRLTEREIAVYAVVLDLIYDGGHQTLNDPKHIASYFVDLGSAAVKRTIDRLVEVGKLEIDGEYLTNKRARNQGKTRRELAESRRNAGRLGGVSSGKSRSGKSENNGLGEANAEAKGSNVSSVEGEGEREKEKKTLGASAPSEPAPPDRFDEFWSVYPKREGANPKKPAQGKFKALVAKGTDPDVIIAAARHLAKQHPTPTRFCPQAVTWLGQERFADDDARAPPPRPVPEVRWKQRLDLARRSREWFPDDWGPIPGEAGCQVPVALRAEGDGIGWVLKSASAA